MISLLKPLSGSRDWVSKSRPCGYIPGFLSQPYNVSVLHRVAYIYVLIPYNTCKRKQLMYPGDGMATFELLTNSWARPWRFGISLVANFGGAHKHLQFEINTHDTRTFALHNSIPDSTSEIFLSCYKYAALSRFYV
jgi:hypothetical protein